MKRFVIYPSAEAAIAHVLWVAHTHLMDAWFTTPRLAALSPEPGSGKSRLLEITALLVPRAILTVQSSPAYILRKISDQANRPTILCDEIDAIFGPNAKGNEDLRAMINAGYRRGATIGRCQSDKGKVETVDLSTYGAIAMGGLGSLPATIESRSVIIRMRKRALDEKVEPFKPIIHETIGNDLNDELNCWARAVDQQAELADPMMPDGIADRNAEVWLPLLAVADLAGGKWPSLARAGASCFVGEEARKSTPSLPIQLLNDIQRYFGEAQHMSTVDLLRLLHSDDEAPWGDVGGRKLDARKLATMLRPFNICSVSVRLGDATPKGYRRADFEEVWRRYLPISPGNATSDTSATAAAILPFLGSPLATKRTMIANENKSLKSLSQ